MPEKGRGRESSRPGKCQDDDIIGCCGEKRNLCKMLGRLGCELCNSLRTDMTDSDYSSSSLFLSLSLFTSISVTNEQVQMESAGFCAYSAVILKNNLQNRCKHGKTKTFIFMIIYPCSPLYTMLQQIIYTLISHFILLL